MAKDTWHFPCPVGAKGRYIPYNYCFYGVWSFGQNKSAAKAMIQYLQERKQVGEREVASEGYDLPPLLSMSDFDIWSEVEPPKGTVYNYPIRPWHNALESITAYPAPPDIAAQMYSPRNPSDHVGKSLFRAIERGSDRLGKERAGRVHALTA